MNGIGWAMQVVALTIGAGVATAQNGAEITLAEILAFAQEHAPRLRVAERRVAYGDKLPDAVPWLRSNPTVEFGMGPRFSSGTSDYDLAASLQQPIEIAGQRGLEKAAYERTRDRLRIEAESLRWDLHSDVHLAFNLGLLARERREVTQRVLQSTEEIRTMAQRRAAAGEINLIELRVAESDYARAYETMIAADQELQSIQLKICELSGWPIEKLPLPSGALQSDGALPALEKLMEAARDQDPKLRIRRAEAKESDAEATLAARNGWPTLTLGVSAAREGSAGSPENNIILGTLGVEIPAWQRNQLQRSTANMNAAVSDAEVEVRSAMLDNQVRRAYAATAAALNRVRVYREQVIPNVGETLALLQRAFIAGEIDALRIAVAREQILKAQQAALVATEDFFRALANLEALVGTEIEFVSMTGELP